MQQAQYATGKPARLPPMTRQVMQSLPTCKRLQLLAVSEVPHGCGFSRHMHVDAGGDNRDRSTQFLGARAWAALRWKGKARLSGRDVKHQGPHNNHTLQQQKWQVQGLHSIFKMRAVCIGGAGKIWAPGHPAW